MGRHDIIHTCAASYISNQSGLGISAAEQAADRKIKKYEGLLESPVFQPIAIETMGRYNSSALGFIGEIGRRHRRLRVTWEKLPSFIRDSQYASNATTWWHLKVL